MDSATINNAKISARIIAKIGEGLSLPEAFDAIMGTGAYKAFAGDLYDSLQAKA